MNAHDRIHAVVSELGCMADMLQAMNGTSQRLPVEWLAEWANRLNRDLDDVWLEMGKPS